MAIKASFLPGARALTVFGDELDNTSTASRDAAGSILINGGAVPSSVAIRRPPSTRLRKTRIDVPT